MVKYKLNELFCEAGATGSTRFFRFPLFDLLADRAARDLSGIRTNTSPHLMQYFYNPLFSKPYSVQYTFLLLSCAK